MKWYTLNAEYSQWIHRRWHRWWQWIWLFALASAPARCWWCSISLNWRSQCWWSSAVTTSWSRWLCLMKLFETPTATPTTLQPLSCAVFTLRSLTLAAFRFTYSGWFNAQGQLGHLRRGPLCLKHPPPKKNKQNSAPGPPVISSLPLAMTPAFRFLFLYDWSPAQSSVCAFDWQQGRWPWMTLNCNNFEFHVISQRFWWRQQLNEWYTSAFQRQNCRM